MKNYLLPLAILLAFFTQSCLEGNTQETEQEEVLNQRIDSLFLAGIPQGKLANPLLEEVSGMVVSQRYPNRLYVHTDSGGEAAVYVLDTLGNELGKLALSGLNNRDWEDIAVGPGPNGSSYIYVAEIGDNEAKHEETSLYRFAEPELLQAIPSELLEAAAIDGANPRQIFRKITLPLLLQILSPLLIASFAFNFNNFNLIFLLTGGGPRNELDGEIAGATDILISYTYKIAFGSGTQDLGLASAISLIIFILVASISLYSLRKSKVLETFA